MSSTAPSTYLRDIAVLDLLDEGLCLIREGAVVETNRRFDEMTGTASSALPATIDTVFQNARLHSGQAHESVTRFIESANDKKHHQGEITLRHPRPLTAKIRLQTVSIGGEELRLCLLNERAGTSAHADESERLQTIVDNIDGVALFIKDLQGRYELVNNYVSHHICDTPPIGKTCDSVHTEESARLMQRVDRTVINNAETITYDETVTYKDGTLHHHRTTKIPIKGADGKVESVLGVSVDLSEQAAIEEQLLALNRELEARVEERTAAMTDAYDALKTSEARYRMIIETTSEGVWIIDRDRRTIEVNSSLSRMLGYTQEEMLGRTPMEFVDEENRKIFKTQTDTIESSDYRSYQISLTRKDGSQLPTIFHANTIRDENGEVLMACAFVTDISEIKQVKADLQNKHDQMQAIFKSTREGLAIIDMQTNFLEVNPAYSAITGYGEEELLTQSCLALSSEAEDPCAFSVMEQLKLKGYVDTFEKASRTKEGEPLYLHMSAAMLDDGEHAVVAIKDITQMKQSQEALAQLNATLQEKIDAALQEQETQQLHLRKQQRLAAMGEMLAMIAHQWRQPLTSISVTAATMLFKNTMDEYDKKFFDQQLHNISSYAQHLSRTIDDFRNFFKEDKTRSDVTVESVVDSALSIIEVSLASRGIAVEKVFRCHHTFSLHANELKQVVLNLLKNAEDVLVEQHIGSPAITVETRCDEEKVELLVRDNGGGIAADVIDKIFEPYFTTKEEINGTGLGLYMSKTIIEEHCNGTIHAQNTSEGALFTITLPTPLQS